MSAPCYFSVPVLPIALVVVRWFGAFGSEGLGQTSTTNDWFTGKTVSQTFAPDTKFQFLSPKVDRLYGCFRMKLDTLEKTSELFSRPKKGFITLTSSLTNQCSAGPPTP